MIRSMLLILVCLFSLATSFTTQAEEVTQTTTTVEKHVVITPPPKSVSCTTTAAHWEGDVWITTQTVCKYDNRAEGVAWVQDYWACTVATAAGDCTTWEFRPGHWVKTLE